MPRIAELLRLSVSQADTVITRMVPPAAGWFERTTEIAGGILTLLTVALMVGGILALIRLRRSFEAAQSSLDEVSKDVRELVDATNRIAQDFAGVSDSVRKTAAGLNDTVEYANERARRAVSQLADRVDEFNGALAAVQHDTQNVVVSALAALKGVRAGMDAIRRPRRKRDRENPDDGFDVDGDAPDLPARPRLRRRARTDG
jgi:uncharacterized protein YoxC